MGQLAGVEKLANSMDSKSIALKGLRVRVPPPAPNRGGHKVFVASERFDQLVQTNSEWNPNEIFDLIEDICDVTYNERWHAIS